MSDTSYYVYIHRRASDGKVFYVGKGKGQRAWNFSNRNRHWTNVKNKHGVEVEIVFDNLEEKEALQIEKDTILEFTYFGYPLTNKSSGGESPVFCKETLEKLKHRPKRKKSKEEIDKIVKFHTGRKRSEETCERISKALTGRTVNPEAAERSRLNRSGTKAKIADQTCYHFIHTSGEEFIGTRMELCEKYDLNKKLLHKLFGKHPRKSTMNWSLLIEKDNDE